MYRGVGQYIVNGKKEYHVQFQNEDCMLDILVKEKDPLATPEMIRSMEELVQEAYDFLVRQEERHNERT